MLKPRKLSSWKLKREFWQQVSNFISSTSAGSICVYVATNSVHVNVPACGRMLLYPLKRAASLGNVPQGSSRVPVALSSASPGASLLSPWHPVRPPVCKHSIYRWYERLSEMWWLSSELRAGDCCHLRGQRWDWLREGEIQRASLTW